MKIATRLRVAGFVPIVLAALVVAGLAVSNVQISNLHEQEARAVEISVGLSELNDLARTYVAEHEQRPRQQFKAKFEQVTMLVEQAQEGATEYGALLDRMATDLFFVGSLFDRVVANYEQSGAEGDPLFTAAERSLAGQLFLRSRDANRQAAQLANNLGADIVEQQSRTYTLGAIYAFLTALLLAVGVITLLRSVNDSIERLTEGTEIVGGGDLGYRITLTTRDELTELARSFNRMTGRLQSATVSTRVLEEEAERRTRTARELDAAREQLEIVLANMQEAVGVWNPAGEQIRMNQATLRMHGFSSEAEMRRHLSEFKDVTLRSLDGRELPTEEWPAARAIRGESFSDWELEVSIPSNGIAFIGSYSGAPVLDAHGNLLLGIITVHDMTAVYKAQEQTRQELARTQVLLDVSAALTTWRDLDLLLRNLAKLVLEASNHRRVTIALVEEDTASVRIAAGAGEQIVAPGTRLPIDGLTPQARDMLATGRITLVDHDAMPEEERGATRANAGRLALYAPLAYGDHAFGYIALDDPGERQPFSPREVDIVEAIASQAAIAVENARRYQAEHDIAERLQTALLEIPEELRGLEFGNLYRAASQSARVGGDFYDLFDLDDHLVGITIGDVAGKGLDAAALTSLVKNTVRAHAHKEGRSPARVLELTNETVFRASPLESFVTVVFAVLDRRDGALSYAGAGHPGGIVVRPDGATTLLESNGPILGAFPKIGFADRASLRMQPGDLLFLYTDGLSEARRGDVLFGEERVIESVSRHAGESPGEVVEGVVADALAYSEGHLRDDVAVLAVRLAPER
jgi:serine phosphatase RsbU (regulator of sigma subunit)/PAS domain-containing protein